MFLRRSQRRESQQRTQRGSILYEAVRLRSYAYHHVLIPTCGERPCRFANMKRFTRLWSDGSVDGGCCRDNDRDQTQHDSCHPSPGQAPVLRFHWIFIALPAYDEHAVIVARLGIGSANLYTRCQRRNACVQLAIALFFRSRSGIDPLLEFGQVRVTQCFADLRLDFLVLPY